MSTVGELHDSLQPGESTYLTHAGITWEITRLDLGRRVEDEGQWPWEMTLERDLMVRGECEACGEHCDTPPVCRDCGDRP